MRGVQCYFMIGLVILVATGIIWLRERDFKTTAKLREENFNSTIQAQQKLIETRDEEYTALLDRLFRSKNLPPTDVNLTTAYEQQKQTEETRRVERRNGGPITGNSIGPVDSAQLAMAMDVRRRESPKQ